MSDEEVKKEGGVTLPIRLSEKLVAMFVEQRDVKKAHRAKQKSMHEAIWEAIHEEFPALSRDKNYSCDIEYMDTGVVFLKNSDSCELLDGIFAKALSSAVKRD